jgi:hypothetical protein
LNISDFPAPGPFMSHLSSPIFVNLGFACSKLNQRSFAIVISKVFRGYPPEFGRFHLTQSSRTVI